MGQRSTAIDFAKLFMKTFEIENKVWLRIFAETMVGESELSSYLFKDMTM